MPVYLVVDGNEPPCRCGNRGCLEAYAGLPAVMRDLAAVHGDRLTLRNAITRAEQGDELLAGDVFSPPLNRSLIDIVSAYERQAKGHFMSTHSDTPPSGARTADRRLRALAMRTAALGAGAIPALSVVVAPSASAAPPPTVDAGHAPRAVDPLSPPGERAWGDPVPPPHLTPTSAASIKLTGAHESSRAELGAPKAPVKKAVAPKPTAKQDSAGRQYQVKAGDTLYHLAAEFLGDGSRYPEIFAANQNRAESDGGRFTDPNLIRVGWVLDVPGTESGGPTTLDEPVAQHKTRQPPTKSTSRPQDKQASQSTPSGGLDDWIDQARTVLARNGIQVSHDAIHIAAMNESSGNPSAINLYDGNAAAGHPSIGLLQTIQPTFDAYALDGHRDIYNPVDNIIAAVRYATANYGSLEEVVASRCGGSCWRGY